LNKVAGWLLCISNFPPLSNFTAAAAFHHLFISRSILLSKAWFAQTVSQIVHPAIKQQSMWYTESQVLSLIFPRFFLDCGSLHKTTANDNSFFLHNQVSKNVINYQERVAQPWPIIVACRISHGLRRTFLSSSQKIFNASQKSLWQFGRTGVC
jgi:hypothetical protein